MKLSSLTPILNVTSLEETIRFYHDMLGFECAGRSDRWAALQHGDVELMISLPNAHVFFERPQFTGSLYFNLEDVDSLWEQLRNKADVVYPIENFFYGRREFAIRDNNGYCLNFGSPIADSSPIPASNEG